MSQESRELVLFAENDGRLMTKRFPDFAKNLVVKKAQGKYDRAKAKILMMYFAEEAAKAYAKDFGGIFSKRAREETADYFRDYFERRWDEGHYREFVPKKYIDAGKPRVGASRRPKVR